MIRKGLQLANTLKSKIVRARAQASGRLQNAPLMTILFATSTSLLLYQNCSPAPMSSSASNTKQTVYSSTIGGYTGGAGSGGGSGSGGGAVPVPGGGGSVGGGGSGGTGGGGSGGGATPIDTGGGTGGSGGSGGGAIGGGGSGGTGVNPGGSTGGTNMDSFVWQYQPEDRTVEEGEILTLSAYATKGINLVTYQWYKNGAAISGQTSYLYRAFLVPISAGGTYHVEAKSGADTIRSMSITVKVKAARNACLAGKYGTYPGRNNFDEYYHESFIGATNARVPMQKELPDGYTIKLPYGNPFATGINDCITAVGIFQCRNGVLISTEQVTCTQYRDSGGG